jgi:serine/threonine protein kinase
MSESQSGFGDTLPDPPTTPQVDADGCLSEVRPCPDIPDYKIEKELGRGGMGVVYQARQLSLDRPVALKMLLSGYHANEIARVRFQREAEAAARLAHPNVVRIYEVGTHDGWPFFSMELIDGGTLADRLHEGPLSPRAAAELVGTLARAVFVAHEAGIVHRDLKPANILLETQERTTGDTGSTGEDNQKKDLLSESFPVSPVSPVVPFVPKITDFGLARRLDVPGGTTLSGEIIGTPAYMAPEQAQGSGRGGLSIGRAADVWALGTILYECLTGRPPFLADVPVETLRQVIEQEPVPPARLRPDVPRDLQTICLRCLEKNPRRRYVSALSLANDLAHFLAGETIIARPAGRIERTLKWARRRPALAALLVTLTAGTLLCLLLVTGAWRQAEQARGREEELRLTAEGALLDAEKARGKEKEARLREEERRA